VGQVLSAAWVVAICIHESTQGKTVAGSIAAVGCPNFASLNICLGDNLDMAASVDKLWTSGLYNRSPQDLIRPSIWMVLAFALKAVESQLLFFSFEHMDHDSV
jgi:hypothetical protein